MDMPSLPERLVAHLADRYVLEREIGRGGMAAVYQATDIKHERPVALKVLHPSLARSLFADRFLREIRIAACLAHPHILPLHDSGRAEDQLYYTMPYVAGESLRQRLRREHWLTVEDAVKLVREVADALAYAHAHGIVHRDIKPENILLVDGHAVVADFGIARALDAAGGEALTEPGLALGTALYMSPEQAEGRAEVDGRSDVYSLGCVFYEMLAGAPPFAGTTALGLLARHASEPVPLVRTVRPAVRGSYERAIVRAMAKDPADRFLSATAFRDALEETDAVDAYSPRPSNNRADRPIVTIAVLAFESTDVDGRSDFLGEGIAEEIITVLTRVPGLRVASRTSAFSFRGKHIDVREIGRQLDVGAVVEGSVRQSGERIRVTVQLCDAVKGFEIWSEHYTRPLTNILDVQDEIARDIVEALRINLPLPAMPLAKRHTENVEAYQLFLRGRFFWNRRYEGGLQRSIECFRKALELDPSYAPPYAGLADAFNSLGAYEYLPPRDAFTRATAAAQRALDIDPTLAEAHTTLGSVQAHHGWQWETAEASLRRALELDDQYPFAHAYQGLMLTARQRHDEAIDAMRRAIELDPLALIINALLGWTLYYARRFDEAIAQYRLTLEMDPSLLAARVFLAQTYLTLGRFDDAVEELQRGRDIPTSLAGLGYAFGATGRQEEARAVLRQMDALAGRAYVSTHGRAIVHVGLGELDVALTLLERSADERPYMMSFLGVNPLLDPLRDSPRFHALLDRMGLTRASLPDARDPLPAGYGSPR